MLLALTDGNIFMLYLIFQQENIIFQSVFEISKLKKEYLF